MGGPAADAERVAIARRTGDTPYTNAARGATHVFNDNGLTERRTHTLSHDTSERVSRSRCRVGHDHRDRTRRIDLCRRALNECENADQGQRRKNYASCGHRVLLRMRPFHDDYRIVGSNMKG